MKKLVGFFKNTILILGLLLIVQTNKTLAAGTFNTAVELKENIAVEKRLEAGQGDYYYFITPQSALYEIETTSGINSYGYLYDENYNEIISKDDGGEGSNFKISKVLEANKKYYVKVKGCYSSTEGNYKITLKKIKLFSNSILGKVSLPDGQVAPAGGIDIDIVSIRIINGYNWNDEADKKVHIDEGKSSVEYSIPVASDESGAMYKIRYGTYNKNYGNIGYYNTDGTVLYMNSSSKIQVNGIDISGINLTLLPIRKISGKVSLPDGEIASAGGVYVDVQAIKLINDSLWGYELSKKVHIEAGQSSADYSIPVSCDVSGANYKIIYGTSNEDYGSEGYYNINKTVIDINSASVIHISETDITGIDIVLFPTRKIAGRISLPNGELAPVGGIELYVDAKCMIRDSYWGVIKSKTVIIKEGENSAEYTLQVPYSETEIEYIIAYHVMSYKTNYLEFGYYSESETMLDEDSAGRIKIFHNDVNDINIEIVKGILISGKIALPQGEVASQNGLGGSIELREQSTNLHFSTNFGIMPGESEDVFKILLPNKNQEFNYIVSYSIDTNGDIPYVSRGYYNNLKTTYSYNLATKVKVKDVDVTDLNMEIIKGKKISGRISLPDGQTVPRYGMNVNIFVSDKESTMNFNTNLYLNQWENGGNYSITVPGGNESRSYIVGYNFSDISKGIYVKDAYYNSVKTTTNPEEATLVEVSNNDIENVNMTLIPGKIIRGTITIPDDWDTLNSLIEFKIIASDELNSVKVQNSVYRISSEKSMNYNLVVPSDSNLSYKVSYELPEYYNGSYLKRGYYSNNGTVANRKDASVVIISGGQIGFIDMTLLKLTDIPDDYGDNMQNAALIESNSINDGIINDLGDKDYFKFEVLQTSLIKLYTTGTLATRGELFNGNGDSIVVRNQSILDNNLNIIQVLEPGTYYLEVSSDKLGVYSVSIESTINSSENQYKISVSDYGQIPTIETIYFEGQEGVFDFEFNTELSYDISKVGNEYVVSLMGFDWSRADKYYVWINDGTYLLKQSLTSADKGKTIMLKRGDTYTNIKIDIESIGQNLKVQNFCLYQDWNNGTIMLIGNINKDMYIPMGEYGIQISGYNESDGYSLLKNKINISKGNNVIYFKGNELAKLSVDMEDYSGSELELSSFFAAYFNHTYSLNASPNMSNIYVSKASYGEVFLDFKTKDSWRYQYPINDANISEDKTLKFDSQLSCKINLEKSHFNPNQFSFLEGQLEITDSYNNSLDNIRNINFQQFKNVTGKIKLENATEKYELTINSLENPYIMLPNTNGTFIMTFYVDEGPVKIKSASTIITIGDPNASSLKNYDLNFDGSVDINDIEVLGEGYGTENGDSSYDVNEDLNGDGVIDIFDLVILSKKIKQ